MPHPCVRVSASGRKALYLGWHAVAIVGWSEEEGLKLLALALPGHVLKIVFACFLLLVSVRLVRDSLVAE